MKITRLVKMKFRPAEVEIFTSIFERYKTRIAGSKGCLRVELKRDADCAELFFTISEWNSEDDLLQYRKSDLFNEVWKQTKILFAEKAEAWTVK